MSTDPTDKAARRSIAACAREAALARARHEHSDGVIAEAVAADVVAALRDRGFLATTGDTPRGVLRSGDFDGIARKVIADYPRDVYGQVAVVSMLREAAAQGAQLASAGGEDNGDRTAAELDAQAEISQQMADRATQRFEERHAVVDSAGDDSDDDVLCQIHGSIAMQHYVTAERLRARAAELRGVSTQPGTEPGEAQQ